MRVVAIANSEGKIFALATMPKDGARPSMAVPPMHHEVELDFDEVPDDASDETLARLREVVTDYVVDFNRRKLQRQSK